MSVVLRPVVEQWGESYTYSLNQDEMLDLIEEVAARAEAGQTIRTEYGDLVVMYIQEGRKFLDLLAGGREAMLRAKAEGKDNYDLYDRELNTIDELATLTPAWQRSVCPRDGSLRIYVD
jgi:hypothetical protein